MAAALTVAPFDNCIIYDNTAINRLKQLQLHLQLLLYARTRVASETSPTPRCLLTRPEATCTSKPIRPASNAGTNSYVGSTVDRDGNLRIVGGTVDIGAYEDTNRHAGQRPARCACQCRRQPARWPGRLTWSPAAKAATYNGETRPRSSGAYTNLATGLTVTNYTIRPSATAAFISM